MVRIPGTQTLVWGVVLAGMAATVVTVALLSGLALAVLCVAGGVLVAAVFLAWGSVQSLTGGTPLSLEEAISLGAPSAEEERKQSVLRALKDLDYERSVGKISESDYLELSARYRAEAKALLKALDRDLDPFRQRVLDELLARTEASGSASPDRTPPEEGRGGRASANEPPLDRPKEPAARAPDSAERQICPSCGARNDLDARFCKGCGIELRETSP
jgi:ribosomal protein L40E